MARRATVPAQPAAAVGSDREYDMYLANVQRRFMTNTEQATLPMFTTDVEDLWGKYLSWLPEDRRQHHNCHACRRFIERFAGLVVLDNEGCASPVLWDMEDAPPELCAPVQALITAIRKAKVTGVFVPEKDVCGEPVTGPWHHLSIRYPATGGRMYKHAILSPFQVAAAKKEDHKNMMLALSEFSIPQLEQAVKILEADALYCGEKVLGQATWLLELKRLYEAADGKHRANVVWYAIALAPDGFCHPRSSMIGTLLEDILAGMDFNAIAKRFAEKMHPLQYQRPQVAPSAGTIKQAENVVEKLGAAGSLKRRFARLSDIQALWVPRPGRESPQATGTGVFGDVKPKGARVTPQTPQDIKMPAQTITWVKFRQTALENADKIEVLAPHSSSCYGALVTAVDPAAPPIIQWDTEEFRNPVSWYLWPTGAPAYQMSLRGGDYVEVDAICLGPYAWRNEDDCSHQGRRAIFILKGAKETRSPSLCLFPTVLRNEFHGVRSVIESYSRANTLEGLKEDHAAGLIMCSSSDNWNLFVRVTARGLVSDYKIDRWD